MLGSTVAASPVWNILEEHGIGTASERTCTTGAAFPCRQAQAIRAVDFFAAKTFGGATSYVLATV
ncbi:hypothetical protein ABT215_24855 [Streptomyces sp900105755]|uniref:hypothetical protein n=1 Tax=Streptomyces sp. 900105755 TaxID=3154389 RepID=UPI00332F6CDB